MAILWRVNPRKGRSSLAALLTQRRSTAAGGLVGTDEFFGLVGQAETGQGSQTSDISASASAPAGATIQTGQGSQTSDGVFSVVSNATIQTGQGSQTSDIVATTPFVATIETGQGSQTSDATGIITSFQSIGPRGWWDSANETVHPGASFWQLSPRLNRMSLPAMVVRRGATHALGPVAEDEAFTVVPWTHYEDGIGTHSVSNGSRTIALSGDEFGAFGSATVYNLNREIIVPGISSNEGFGTPLVIDMRTYVAVDGANWGAFGTPSLENLNRTIYPQRIGPGDVGDATVIGPQYISGATVGQTDEFGDNEIAGSRTVYPSSVSSAEAFGTSYIAFSTRDVRPTSVLIMSNQVPEPTIANSARTVAPIGISDTTAGPGDPIVAEPPFDVIEYAGVGDTSEFGDLDTELSGTVRRIRLSNSLHPINVPAIGTPKIDPHTIHPGYVRPGSYGDGGVIGPESFGVTRISNWIRYIDLSLGTPGRPEGKGISSWRVGSPRVSNWIRYIEPAGWDHSEVWFNFNPPPDGQLANVRHVSDGKLYPGSINDGAFGEPSLRFNFC